jgi:hypothetical protein
VITLLLSSRNATASPAPLRTAQQSVHSVTSVTNVTVALASWLSWRLDAGAGQTRTSPLASCSAWLSCLALLPVVASSRRGKVSTHFAFCPLAPLGLPGGGSGETSALPCSPAWCSPTCAARPRSRARWPTQNRTSGNEGRDRARGASSVGRVLVESTPRLPAQAAGQHHLAKQRAGPVSVLALLRLQA